MKDKNSIEDFFSNAFEHFNDSPSDLVWDGIAQKLNKSLPFYKKPFFWLGFSGLIILLLMTCGLFTFHKEIQDLEKQNAQLIQQNKTFKNDLIQNQKKIRVLNKEKNQLQNEFSNYKIKSKENKIFANQNHNKNTNSNRSNYQNKNLRRKFFSDKNNGNINGGDGNIKYEKLPPRGIEAVYFPNPNKIESHHSLKRFNPESELFCNTNNNFTPKFKYGIQGEFYRVFSDLPHADGHTHHVNLGGSLHLIANYALKPKLHLVGGLGYSEFKHVFEVKQNNLDYLEKFPEAIPHIDEIEEVHLQKEILNLMFGFKYDIISKTNYKIFAQITGVGKIYFPENYHYHLKDRKEFDFQEDGFSTYFNSLSGSIGIERKLRKRMTYQLSLFTEQSFEPQGKEEAHILLLGLRMAILLNR